MDESSFTKEDLSENSNLEINSSSAFNSESNTNDTICDQNEYNTNYSDKLTKEYDTFFFESDTLALKNNKDYSSLLKTLFLLENQRIQALKDLETLHEFKEKSLSQPFEFVKQLTCNKNDENNKDFSEFSIKKIPQRQKIYVLPEIDWNKYYENIDLEDLETIKKKKEIRIHSLRQTNKLINKLEKTENNNSNTITRNQSKESKEERSNYNKPWTVEEQRNLEELLLEFPPEENEAHRCRKIANKLGTRTPLQVQSHCQKYFIKLAKAGLPIPGRMPNLKTYTTKKGTRGRGSSIMRVISGGRGNSNNSLTNSRRMVGRGSSLNEISSMWTSFNPPIIMNDEQDNDFEDH